MDGLLELPAQEAQQAARTFEGFGPTAFAPRGFLTGEVKVRRVRSQTRENIRGDLPPLPGVYGMVDQHDRLVYVGMSGNIRSRVSSYFHNIPRGDKQYKIARAARRLVWESVGHEFCAWLRELELIRRFQPKFNSKGRPLRIRSGYIYLTVGDAPHFRVAGAPPKGCRWSIGPVPWTKRTSGCLDRLNYQFRLRDCPAKTPMQFIEQMQLFEQPLAPLCLRGELGTCIAPCARSCTREQYADQIELAKDFIVGRDRKTLPTLEASMQEASRELRFERAAALRDTWRQLRYLGRQTRLAHGIGQQWFVYPLVNDRRTVWHCIAGGKVAAAIYEPQTPRQRRRALTRLEEVFQGGPSSHVLPGDDFPHALLIAAWFRRKPKEKRSVLTPEAAMEICREDLNPLPR